MRAREGGRCGGAPGEGCARGAARRTSKSSRPLVLSSISRGTSPAVHTHCTCSSGPAVTLETIQHASLRTSFFEERSIVSRRVKASHSSSAWLEEARVGGGEGGRRRGWEEARVQWAREAAKRGQPEAEALALLGAPE